jgi:hypothetical protein
VNVSEGAATRGEAVRRCHAFIIFLISPNTPFTQIFLNFAQIRWALRY